MAKSTEPTPTYASLKAEAKALGIPYVGVKGPALAAAIAAAQADADWAATLERGDARTAARAPATPSKGIPITRQTATTWWCPIDDFAMPTYMQGCNKCGAKRVGEAVIPV